MTRGELEKRINSIGWFQRYNLGGIMTPGIQDIEGLLSRIEMPEDLTGKFVLDCGANDGALTWESERRGADLVVALDHPTWGMAGHDVLPRDEGFKLGYDINNSQADVVTRDLDRDWLPITWNGFDLILFCGVLYHLKAPILVLEKVANALKPGGLLIIETHVACLDVDYPASKHYPCDYLVGDSTNYTGPNPQAVLGWMARFGLISRQVGQVLHCQHHNHRAVFHARKPS